MEDSLSVLEGIILGRPKDERENDFKKMVICSASPNRQHTMAQMVVNFQDDCSTVMAEVQARASGENGWKDPHNRGKYAVEATEGNLMKLKRRTGNDKYTDLISFQLQAGNGGSCSAQACSVSQSNSNNDAGTNMCNMMNLFCNSGVENGQTGVKCAAVNSDLQYSVANLDCGRYRNDGRYRTHQCQDFATTCLKQQSVESIFLSALPELGRPQDEREKDFKKQAICADSPNTQHTM